MDGAEHSGQLNPEKESTESSEPSRRSWGIVQWGAIATIAILVFYFVSVEEEDESLSSSMYSIQIIKDLSRPQKLTSHTTKGHWWFTNRRLDPKEESRNILNVLVQGKKEEAGDWQLYFSDYYEVVLFPGSNSHSLDSVQYRKVFVLPEQLSEPVALLFRENPDRERVYLNGHFVGQSGEWNSRELQTFTRERMYVLPKSILNLGGPNVLLIEAQGGPSYHSISRNVIDYPEIGYERVLVDNSEKRQSFFLTGVVVVMALGFLSLFLYLGWRDNLEYLLFSIFCWLEGIYFFVRFFQLPYEWGWNIDFLLMMTVFTASTVPVCLYLFFKFYFRMSKTFLVRGLDFFVGLYCALVIIKLLSIVGVSSLDAIGSFVFPVSSLRTRNTSPCIIKKGTKSSRFAPILSLLSRDGKAYPTIQ